MTYQQNVASSVTIDVLLPIIFEIIQMLDIIPFVSHIKFYMVLV